MDRRDFLVAGAALGAVPFGRPTRESEGDDMSGDTGRLKQSVARWYFSKRSVDETVRIAKSLGLQSVDLLEPDEWATARAHGLVCAMGYAPAGDPKTRLTVGWNREANHAWLLPGYRRGLELAAAAGVPNIICFSGSRGGLGDAAGLATCAAGLRQLMPDAERLGVTVCMELLNSKVDHPDYQCDHTAWGAALVDRVGSPRFKLLYDIYHMQIMEGDVIRTIREHHAKIAHYHVGGVPGRHEPDNSQELYYPAVMRAIADGGFTGYVAQEFVPTGEPVAALAAAVRICRV
ncbi:hydroxypyruvate isomerase [Gemmatimonadetes bacterium T265]|nr:hydroxypyruvate isomerase [Gemmatimonadetes bacterium T265]